MTVDDLRDLLVEHKDALFDSLLQGTYEPQPVRRVEIPSAPMAGPSTISI